MGKSPIAARPHIAYMFARDALLPWRTASRNVEFALELRRPDLGRRERRERAHALLDSLGLGRAKNLYPWQLSQGMRQRVALARTWVIEPDVLLMDEPFAALDAQTRADVQQMFLEMWSRDRRTVVFVTHDLGEAILLGDRVIVLADGRRVDEVEVEIPRPRDALTIVEQASYRHLHRRLVAGLSAGAVTRGVGNEREDQ
jgi:NitT/TauT family transport system ATP-binding protein